MLSMDVINQKTGSITANSSELCNDEASQMLFVLSNCVLSTRVFCVRSLCSDAYYYAEERSDLRQYQCRYGNLPIKLPQEKLWDLKKIFNNLQAAREVPPARMMVHNRLISNKTWSIMYYPTPLNKKSDSHKLITKSWNGSFIPK